MFGTFYKAQCYYLPFYILHEFQAEIVNKDRLKIIDFPSYIRIIKIMSEVITWNLIVNNVTQNIGSESWKKSFEPAHAKTY